MKRLIATVLLTFLYALLVAACDWSNSCFSGTDDCTTETCGVNCHETSFGVEQFKCYTSGSAECCLCQYRFDECDCTFGTGWARITKKWKIPWTVCDGGSGCGTGCVGWLPPGLPL